jgi:hypothetical protein
VSPLRTIVISPHCDDAVLSSWLTLRESSDPRVIVVFDGVPDMHSLTYYDAFTGATSSAERASERLREDRSVLEALGADRVGLGLLDAQYRDENDLGVHEVASLIAAAVSPAAHILVPAAIGGHSDHLLARNAALQALRGSPARISLYADIPYATYFGWPESVSGVPANPHLNIDAYYARDLSSMSGWSLGDFRVLELSNDQMAAKLASM